MSVQSKVDSITSLANVMSNMSFACVEPPVTHSFSDGVYVREIFMPADMLIVGKIHKTTHLNIVSKGKCVVTTPIRQFVVDATKFPQTFESVAGEQKVVYMIEDTVWSTVHVTTETDSTALEDQLISTEYDETIMNTLVLQAREALL